MKTNDAMKQDLRRFKASIARWERAGERAKKNGDADLAATYQRDVEDLRCIYGLIRDGLLARAASLSDRLDTLVREQIPPRLFTAIHNPAC